MSRFLSGLFVILVAVSFFFLVSCAGNEEEPLDKVEPVEIARYDWRGNGFKPMAKEQDELLYLTDFKKIKADNIKVYSGSNSFYSLTHSEGESVYELGSKLGAEEKSIYDFDIKEWDITKPYLSKYHTYQDGSSVFYVMDEEDENIINSPILHYYMVFVDSSGNFVKKIDVLPALVENKICKSYDFRCYYISQDAGGYHYFWDNDSCKILVLDSEGNTVFCEQLTDILPNEQIECMKTSDDEVVFIRVWSKGARFLLPDFQTSRFVQFFEVAQRSLLKWHGLWGNTIYYSQSDKLKAWNIETGEVKTILNEGEYSTSWMFLELEPVSDGIDIYYHEGTNLYYYMFREEEPVKETTITVANFCSEDEFLQKCRNAYRMENPNISIGYEDCKGDSAKADRIMMDIMKGEGPDIMYVTREEMENLAGHFLLADLSEMISKENLDYIYHAVVSTGVTGGELVALPLCICRFDTILATDRYVTDDTWTTEEIIQIINEHDDELDGIFLNGNSQSYKVNLRMLLGANLLDSEFIHGGKADFENELFKELLNVVKKKTDEDDRIDVNQIDSLLKAGKYLGMSASFTNLGSYCMNYYCEIGPEVHAVGQPGDSGRKIPMEIDGYIVVNHNSKDNTDVKTFVDYLFGFDAQCMTLESGDYGVSVRNDMIEKNLCEDSGYHCMAVRSSGGLSFSIVMPLSAGEPPVEDYESFWDDAIFQGAAQEKIMNMIIEEAEAYFVSDKNLDDVVKSINKRVQVYLDENDL